MRVHIRETLKRNFELTLLCFLSLLFILAVFLNFRTIQRSKIPIIIAIDANGARVVTETVDPIYKTEAIAFIRRFFENSYNFDAGNFMRRVGLATTLMSDQLWKRKQQEILDLKAKVERDQIALKSEILKISQDDSGVYHALIEVHETNRLNQQIHQVKVAVTLNKVERTQNNPFGLEVGSYEETLIRN